MRNGKYAVATGIVLLVVVLITSLQANEIDLTRLPYNELTLFPDFHPIPFGGPDSGFLRNQRPLEAAVDAPPGALYFRLRVTDVVADKGAQYTFTVRNSLDSAVLQRLTADKLSAMRSFLTPPLYVSRATVRVDGPDAPSLSFNIEALLIPSRDAQIRPEEANVSMVFYSRLPDGDLLRDLSQSVAKLYIGEYVCTGFLIESSEILTNFHCLEESDQYKSSMGQEKPKCGDILAQFDYRTTGDRVSGILPSCQEVLATGSYPHGGRISDEGDYALLLFNKDKLRLPTGMARPPLKISSANPARSSRVQSIQHPWGWPLAFTLGCLAEPVVNQPLIVRHNCSTAKGSSGSPLLDGDGLVFAIHHTPSGGNAKEIGDFNEGKSSAPIERRNEATPLMQIWPKLVRYLR